MKMRRKSEERFKSHEKKVYQFLQNLKKEMAKQGVKQRELAEVLEMDETVLSQRFNSRATAWKLAEIFIACDYLQINPGLLFPGGAEYVLGAMSMLDMFNMLMAKNAKKIVLEQMRLLTPEE